MLVFNNQGKILLIERKKTPPGFAPPAGHVDGDTFRDAATRELREEVGLSVQNLDEIARGKKNNHCRRIGGNFHDWRIYYAKAVGKINGKKYSICSF